MMVLTKKQVSDGTLHRFEPRGETTEASISSERPGTTTSTFVHDTYINKGIQFSCANKPTFGCGRIGGRVRQIPTSQLVDANMIQNSNE